MATGKKGLLGAIVLALCLLGIGSSSASQQSSPGDTLVVKIGPLPQNYIYFDPAQAASLIDAVLAGTASYDSANPLCTGSSKTDPYTCVGVGSGVVDNNDTCLIGTWLCTSWTSLASLMLSLPADGSEALSDFTELGLYGLPDAAGTFTQGLVEPDPVQLGYSATEMVLAATNSTTQSVLTEFGCFSSPSGTSNTEPQFVVDLGDYLVIDVSDLDISAGETINLSGLGSVPVAETSGGPYSVFQTAAGCDTGQTFAEDTLNTPVPVNCVSNSTAVPLIQASVENSFGASVPGISVITPTPAAPTACDESVIPPFEPLANNETTVTTTSTMPAPSSTTTLPSSTTSTTTPPTTTARPTPSGWSTPAPIPLRNAYRMLACASASFCMALGGGAGAFELDPSFPLTWSEWNGSRWSTSQNAPNDIGSLYGGGLTCPSSDYCMVWGRDDAMIFDGSTWSTPKPVPVPGAPDIFLSSISCPTSGFCLALDNIGNPLLYSAGAWKLGPSLQGSFIPLGLSCATAQFCVVLLQSTENEYLTYGSVFNGSDWSVPSLIEADTPGSFGGPTVITCVSPSFCVAGDELDRVRTFDGTRWSIPQALGAKPNVIRALQCASATFCIAQSGYVNLFIFDGASWGPAPLPSSEPPNVQLSPFACAAPDFCMTMDPKGDFLTYEH